MFCRNCGSEITDTLNYCPYCGALTEHCQQSSQPETPQPPIYASNTNRPNRQPIAAFIVEGLGILFMLYGAIKYSNSSLIDKAYNQGFWILSCIIGFVLIMVSFIVFLVFKKHTPLTGIGKAGFVISIIAVALAASFFTFMFVSCTIMTCTYTSAISQLANSTSLFS